LSTCGRGGGKLDRPWRRGVTPVRGSRRPVLGCGSGVAYVTAPAAPDHRRRTPGCRSANQCAITGSAGRACRDRHGRPAKRANAPGDGPDGAAPRPRAPQRSSGAGAIPNRGAASSPRGQRRAAAPTSHRRSRSASAVLRQWPRRPASRYPAPRRMPRKSSSDCKRGPRRPRAASGPTAGRDARQPPSVRHRNRRTRNRRDSPTSGHHAAPAGASLRTPPPPPRRGRPLAPPRGRPLAGRTPLPANLERRALASCLIPRPMT